MVLDAFDIMLNQDKIIPYYEPVFSADTQLIIGYEIEPYFKNPDGSIRDIDWFFQDTSIPDEFKIEVNHKILQQAISYFLQEDRDLLLFSNYHAKWLLKDRGENLVNLLQTYTGQGLDLTSIVVEIKNGFSASELDAARTVLIYLKSLGIQIAFDDINEQPGNLERFVLLKPNIIKLDVGFLTDNELPHLYRDVIASFPALTKIGATLLFKEFPHTTNQPFLEKRRPLLQGIIFKPVPAFIPRDFCKENAKGFSTFRQCEEKMKAQLAFTAKLIRNSNRFEYHQPEDPYDKLY